MSEFEEVKKILGNRLTHICDEDGGLVSGQTFYLTGDDKERLAQQICQLFPPYPDALWSDKEGLCFWCKSPTHWVDVCYEGYVCSAKCQQEMAQDVKSKSELEGKTPIPARSEVEGTPAQQMAEAEEIGIAEPEPIPSDISARAMHKAQELQFGFKPKPDRLLTDEDKAKIKGYDSVIDWYLACLNAEINILLDPTLRTSDKLDTLAKQAKIYIEKIAKTASIVADQKDDEYMKDVGTIVKACQKKLVKKEAECQERIDKIVREGLAKIALTSPSKKLAVIETYLEALRK